jgi:hydrogenase nickel incorporation protein HypA/HybF
MHEMSIAESICQIAEEAAGREGGARVKTVFVEIGALAGVELEALRFCWDAVTREGRAASAALDVTHTPGQAWCLQCSKTVALPALYEACPCCGSYEVQVTAGTEMRVKEIEVE